MEKQFSRTLLIGCVFVLLYIIITASSTILVNQTEAHIQPLLLTFYAFLVSTLIFLALSMKNYHHWLLLFQQHAKLVMVINVATAAMWLCVFYALYNFNPAVFCGIFFAVMPLTTIFLTMNQTKKKIVRYYENVFAIFITVVLLLLSFDTLMSGPVKAHSIWSLVLSFLGGIIGALINIIAHRLGAFKFTAPEILSVRFYLLIIITFILLLRMDVVWHLPVLDWLSVISVALVTVVLPLFFLQKSLENIDPVFVSFLTSFVPIITFFIQIFTTQYGFDWGEFLLLLLLSAVLFASVFTKWLLQRDRSAA